MKVSELTVEVRSMLLADKLIHEQQLGWKWQPPINEIFSMQQTIKNTDDKTSKKECMYSCETEVDNNPTDIQRQNSEVMRFVD